MNIIRAAYDNAKKDRTPVMSFRVGMFCITVFNDAKLVDEILGLTVKIRECGRCSMKYLSFDGDELFGIVRNLSSHFIIPCTIIKTGEFDF